MKKGHRKIESTLREDEVVVLDALVSRMEADRVRRCLNPETYRPTDSTIVTRAGLNRAAVRFAMEHEEQFESWLLNDKDAL